MVHRAMLKPKLTTIFDRSANPLNATMEPLKKQNGVYAENSQHNSKFMSVSFSLY